jgi:hypothetical protein
MRTSVDFPDDILRHLKLLSLERDMSLRALLLDLIQKGLASERGTLSGGPSAPSVVFVSPPTIKGSAPMKLSGEQLSNAGLMALLEADDLSSQNSR